MSQRTSAAGQNRTGSRSKLDRAIVLSVFAMVAMNVLVLAQQLQASPLLASVSTHGVGLA